jgi:hypothetical protein
MEEITFFYLPYFYIIDLELSKWVLIVDHPAFKNKPLSIDRNVYCLKLYVYITFSIYFFRSSISILRLT